MSMFFVDIKFTFLERERERERRERERERERDHARTIGLVPVHLKSLAALLGCTCRISNFTVCSN